MAEEYYGWGYKDGWAQSFVTDGGMYSMLWTDSKSVFTLKDINNFDFKMQWVATDVLTRRNQVKERSTIELSLREKEILRWTEGGKTADPIADILMLSPSTINFHLRNAMQKLDAPNKTTAVVRAIFLKLLC